MISWFLGIVLIATSLFAEESKTCYSVQLLSIYKADARSLPKLSTDTASQCQYMKINNVTTLRCGCFDEFSEAQQLRQELLPRYAKAKTVSTYRYRFNTSAIAQSPKKNVQDESTCYTLQVLSVPSSQNIKHERFAKDCAVMQIGAKKAVRCGCYDRYSDAKDASFALKNRYDGAMIMKTYRYRFDTIEETVIPKSSAEIQIDVTPPIKKSTSLDANIDDETLRLMFQVFIYKTNLVDADRIADIGLSRESSSLYWRQKKAEVSRWRGNREISMKHYMYIYSQTHDIKMREDLINYSLNAYQYEDAARLIEDKFKADPSDKNLNDLIYVYDQVGEPQIATMTLQRLYDKNPREFYLMRMLQIYLDIGDLDAAREVVNTIEERNILTPRTASQRAYYYFLNRKNDKAFEALASVKEHVDNNNTLYHRQMSDLGWFMQEFESGAHSASILINTDKGRLVDYERVIYFYQNREPMRAINASIEAYEKFEELYLFYLYAYLATQNRAWEKLRETVIDETFLQRHASLQTNARFWLIRAQVHQHFGEHEKAEKALRQAFSMNPDDLEILTALLWFLIDNNYDEELKVSVQMIEERYHIDSALYLPLSAAHFKLQRSDKSLFYLLKLKKYNSSDVDLKFLYAYIKQIQNENHAVRKEMAEIHGILTERMEKNPLLYSNAEFIDRYLKSGLHVMNPDRFEKELEHAKLVLDEKRYGDLALYRSLRNNAHEQAHIIMQQMRQPEPWMQLNIALNHHNLTGIQDLLFEDYAILPIRDRVQAAVNEGEISLAQTLAFSGLHDNSNDELLYLQKRDLDMSYSDRVNILSGYQERQTLGQFIFDLDLSYYFQGGWSMLVEAEHSNNWIYNHDNFVWVPQHDSSFLLGTAYRYDRGLIKVLGGIRDGAERFTTYKIEANHQLTSRIDIGGEVGKSVHSDESIYLSMGGKKDYAQIQGTYTLLPSVQINATLQKSIYYSQDDKEVGDGTIGRIESETAMRQGYPDFRYKFFYDYARFDSKDGIYTDKGIIDEMMAYPSTALPVDFWNLGMSFHYGMQNRYNYTRVWRPFFELIPYYNGVLERFSGSGLVGYGGSLMGQDQFSIIAEYSQTMDYCQQEPVSRLFFDYIILF